jgi:hypothetical protein
MANIKRPSRTSVQRSRRIATSDPKKTTGVSNHRLSEFTYNAECSDCVDNSWRSMQIKKDNNG